MLLSVAQEIAYCYTGGKPFDARLPTVVLLHGAQNDHSVWGLQSRYFAHHGFSVLAVDLPGHGRSKGAPLRSIEAMADWVLALLDAAGVSQAHLVGHSMGSLIALHTSYLAAPRTLSLGLVGTAWPMKVSDQLLSTAWEDEAAAIEMVTFWSYSTIAPKPSFPGPGFNTIASGRRLNQYIARHSTAKVFHTDFMACNDYAAGGTAAAAVRCPTLFLLGQRDQMAPPRAAAQLIAAIPHAQQTIVEKCGHHLMAEQPDQVLDQLLALIKSVKPLASASKQD